MSGHPSSHPSSLPSVDVNTCRNCLNRRRPDSHYCSTICAMEFKMRVNEEGMR